MIHAGVRIAFVSRERTGRYAGEDERAREPRRIDRLFSRVDGEGWIVDRPASVFVVPVDGSAAPRVGGRRAVRALGSGVVAGLAHAGRRRGPGAGLGPARE